MEIRLGAGHIHLISPASMEVLNTMLAIGESNSQWSPCSAEGDANAYDNIKTGGKYINVSGTDPKWRFFVPLPLNKGSYKLHIKNIEIYLSDADVNNKIDRIRLRGVNNGTLSDLIDDSTGWTSVQKITVGGTAIDCSSYDHIFIYIQCVTASANNLDFNWVKVEFYYD